MSKADLLGLSMWGPDEEEEYRERAAILEFDANLSRAEAEHTARWMVANRSGKAPPSPRAQNAAQGSREAGWLSGLRSGPENAPAALIGDLERGPDRK